MNNGYFETINGDIAEVVDNVAISIYTGEALTISSIDFNLGVTAQKVQKITGEDISLCDLIINHLN